MRVIRNRTLILVYKISAIIKIIFSDRFELNIFDKDGWNLTQITFNKKEILTYGGGNK
jgi:hypothetical protein